METSDSKEKEALVREELIRTATIADLDEISQLEALCFPPAEAASRDAFKWRLLAYPTHFWILEQGGKILSFINGPVTQEKYRAQNEAYKIEKTKKWEKSMNDRELER